MNNTVRADGMMEGAKVASNWEKREVRTPENSGFCRRGKTKCEGAEGWGAG